MDEKNHWSLVFYSCALGLTSYISLKSTPWFMRYARGAQRLHFFTGALATVVYSIPEKSNASIILQQLYVWSYCLSLPLVASEVYLRSGFIPDLAPLHLAIPMFVLIKYYTSDQELDWNMLAVGHTLTLFSMTAASLSMQNIPGILVSVLYLNTMFRDPFGPDMILSFTIISCLINCLLPDTLLWGFDRRDRDST